jgi:hypothetical protein
MANEVRAKEATESSSAFARVSAAVFPYSYHEIADDAHVVRLDVLEQLKANIAQLEDLHGRMRFMMHEVRGLLKKR